MIRVTEVNRELRRRGVEEKLRRGNGYYFFSGGNAASWKATSVYVARAENLSVAEWLAEWKCLSGRELPEPIKKGHK